MSLDAMATCWHLDATWVDGCQDTSPMAVRLVALAIADVVNDLHNNEFFASFGKLAEKVGCHRNTVRKVVRHLSEAGVLLELERGQRGSAGRAGEIGRYRWTWWPERSEASSTGTRNLRVPTRGSARTGTRGAARQNSIDNATDVRAICDTTCGRCGGFGWVEIADRTMDRCPGTAA